MKKKINIAELLKDCPKGMELDCVSYNNVSFDKISDDKKAAYPIFCYITDEEGNRSSISFTENGCESKRYGAKCVIFPKGKNTWEGFQIPFKDGDIVTYEYENELVSMILKKFVNFVEIHHYCALYDNAKGFITNNYIVGEPKYTRFATEEEKQKIFDNVKANGYRWDDESKTLEKLIKSRFKVGDKVIWKHSTITPKIIKKVQQANDGNFNYWIEGDGCIPGWCREDELQKISGKFDINTLKPFDKVLVRDRSTQNWKVSLYSNYNKDSIYPFVTIGTAFYQCIPYEGNEHLLNTTNDCDDFYKTWEK